MNQEKNIVISSRTHDTRPTKGVLESVTWKKEAEQQEEEIVDDFSRRN
jgi:hypothetical protein